MNHHQLLCESHLFSLRERKDVPCLLFVIFGRGMHLGPVLKMRILDPQGRSKAQTLGAVHCRSVLCD